ncbi:MAG: hypothetical protein ACK564_06580 [Novosphingobium sp.]|jgi:hypothetical protein|nr:hypothetical protein [Novosphingobium sp.]
MFNSRLALAAALPLAALVLSQPAAAKPTETGLGEVSRMLGSRDTQHAMAGVLASLANAMLQMDVSAFGQAAEAVGDKRTARRLRKGTTLADVAGRDARAVPGEIRRKAPAMIGAMGAMAGAMEAMLPELAKVAEQMKGALPAGLPGDAPFDPDEPPAGEATAD